MQIETWYANSRYQTYQENRDTQWDLLVKHKQSEFLGKSLYKSFSKRTFPVTWKLQLCLLVLFVF